MKQRFLATSLISGLLPPTSALLRFTNRKFVPLVLCASASLLTSLGHLPPDAPSQFKKHIKTTTIFHVPFQRHGHTSLPIQQNNYIHPSIRLDCKMNRNYDSSFVHHGRRYRDLAIGSRKHSPQPIYSSLVERRLFRLPRVHVGLNGPSRDHGKTDKQSICHHRRAHLRLV